MKHPGIESVGDSPSRVVVFEPCSNAETFLSLLTERRESTSLGPMPLLYRGHGDSSYLLQPTAYREYGHSFLKCLLAAPISDRLLTTNVGQALLEANGLWRFIVEANSAGMTVPELTTALLDELTEFVEALSHVLLTTHSEHDDWQKNLDGRLSFVRPFNRHWPSRSVHRLLAIGQHSGLPTRLLDWTRNPRVAAYFAASDCQAIMRARPAKEAPGYLEIWSIDPVRINEDFRLPYFAHEIERCVATVVPAGGNANLIAQSGAFTIEQFDLSEGGSDTFPASAFDDATLISEETNGSKRDSVAFFRFRLVASQAERLLELLAVDGVTASRLFPTFHGVVRTLQEVGKQNENEETRLVASTRRQF